MEERALDDSCFHNLSQIDTIASRDRASIQEESRHENEKDPKDETPPVNTGPLPVTYRKISHDLFRCRRIGASPGS